MRKLLSLTMLALLVAGAATPTLAITLWAGDAEGNCGGRDILTDWEGAIIGSEFHGYWGGEEDNDMDADNVVVSLGKYYVNYADPGVWDADGWNLPCYGNWWGIFDPVSELCGGSWDEDYGCACSEDDTWSGTKQ